MGKNVLILSGSPRKNGNSDILCDEFMRGAADAGHQVEKIRVAEKKSSIAVPATPAKKASARSTTIWVKSCRK